MKQVIVRIKKGNRTLETAYFYSKAHYEEEILDFAKELKAGQYLQISFGRQLILFYDYEDLLEFAKENEISYDEQLYSSLIENYSIQWQLQCYLPRY